MSEKEEFIQSFNFPKDGFSRPTMFTDGFGFGISKERDQNGNTFVSMYKFYIDENKLKEDGDLKPINILVSYGEKMEDGTVRLSPLSIERKTNWPIDLISDDEFFYDKKKHKFYFKDREITSDQFLEKIESLHTKPTRFWEGFFLRCKLFIWRVSLVNVSKFFYYILIKFLYFISGTKTEKSIWSVVLKSNSIHESKKIEKELFANEKINIFGYRASAWSVVAYSVLHLILYVVGYFFFNIKSDFINKTFSNTFLSIIYVVPSLVLFEHILPKIIEILIKKIGNFFNTISFKKVKI